VDGAGTLSGRWALGAGRAPTSGCAICHGPRLPGARLCAPCKAALKRARLETVADLVPVPSRALAEAEAARRRRAKARSAARLARPRRRPRLLVPALAIAVTAIAAGGYLALRVARPTADSAAAAATPRAQHATPVPLVHVDPSVPGSGEAKSLVEPPAPPPHSQSAAHPGRAAPKRVVETQTVSTAPVDRFPASTEPLVVAPVAPADLVPPAREAPAPDRWQVMADQIARCGRESFLAGVICEQRVRLKYCEGYWGVAAQCPSGLPNDHGQ
jgi:hypothetical protein